MNWLVLTVIVLVACVANISSAADGGVRISFKNVSVSDDGSYNFINVCEPDTSFTFVCDILVRRSDAKTDMNPMITGVEPVRVKQTVTRSTSEDEKYFRYEYKTTPLSDGNLTLTCQARNVIDPPEDKTSVEDYVIVQKPPTRGPTIRVTTPEVTNMPYWDKNNKLDVNKGDQLTFVCDSPSHSYPGVSNITLWCVLGYNDTIVSASNETAPMLTMKFNATFGTCYCKAEHVTGCYDKTSEVWIHSFLEPTITQFVQIHTQPLNETRLQCYKQNMFLCEAYGYPLKLTVTHEPTGKVVPALCHTFEGGIPKEETRYYWKMDDYEDMGNYVCTADDGRGRVVKQTIFANVTSKPVFSPSFDLKTKTFYGEKNGTSVVVIRIPVLSYPDPSNYTVFNDVDKQVVTNGYNITYEPGTAPPKGTVILSMVLSLNEGRKYERLMLTIDNGHGTIDYLFKIAIAKKDSDSGLSAGAKAGIGIGVTLAVIVLIAVAYLVFKKFQRS